MNRRTFLHRAAALAAGAAALVPGRALAWWGSKETTAGEASRKREKHRWRMVTAWPPNFPILQTGAEDFARQVEKLSGGRLTIQVFAGGELVPPLGVFDAVSQGAVQCGHAAAYYWAGKAPASQWFTAVPFGLDGAGMNAWLYHGGGLALWQEVYRPFNLVVRPGGNTGMQMGGWFNREINSLADFKGLKMRIPGLGGKVVAKAGGSVVLLPGAEIYTSLERGVIDATEWIGPAHDMRMGFHKVAKYYYGPGWHEPGSVLELIFNRGAWDKLDEELRAVVETAAAAANVRIHAEFEAANAKALAELQAQGKVGLRRFPDEVLAGLAKLAHEALAEEAGRDPLATKVHQAFTAFRKDFDPWRRIGALDGYGA